MHRRRTSIIHKLAPVLALGLVVAVWYCATAFGWVPAFLLPSPVAVAAAFVSDFDLLMAHARVTLTEAGLGLLAGIAVAFVTATLMDRFSLVHRAVYPLLVITQTIPTIALAPLLVLWMGFGMAPKITLVAVTTYFPLTIGLLDGYASAPRESLDLMRSMGASRMDIFRHVKFPAALSHFFAGLKVSASYAVVGGVIAEWLGGFEGLGVYMTRVKKAYAFDKMFSVILLIIAISLLLMLAVSLLRRLAMPWEAAEKRKGSDNP